MKRNVLRGVLIAMGILAFLGGLFGCNRGPGILDGEEGMFGYASYVNYFRIEPGMDLAVVRGGDKFCAFVKREAETECFYRE